MTISTPHTDPGVVGRASARLRPPRCPKPERAEARPTRRASGGFTLTEVIIAATLSTLILAGVMSAFLMIGRMGFAAGSYSEMETQTRRGLEIFGNDVRKATDVRWNSNQSVTLSVATASNAVTLVTYAYDNQAGSATQGCFYRMLGDASSTLPRLVLMRDVASDFSFQRFKLERTGETDHTAATDLETKQLQVSLRAGRTGVTTADATQTALSARYLLRNKRVAN